MFGSADGKDTADTDRLSGIIADIGRAVSQAAGELQRAADRLMAAEVEAAESDARARDTEALVRAAEERVAEAEARAVAIAIAAEEQGAAADARAEELARAAEGQVAAADARAEELARAAEGQVAAARTQAAELLAGEVEERVRAAEERVARAESRAQAAENELGLNAARISELLSLVERASDEKADAEEQRRLVEQLLNETRERVGLSEQQLRDLQARLVEAESRSQVTVIVDQERDALQQAVGAEVRRPLTSILGLTLALKHHDPRSPEGREMIKQLATSARKLDRLVTQLVDLDKLMSGQLEPNRRRTDVGALVNRVIEETPELANRDVNVATGDRVIASVDPQLTEQMIDTLLANAGKRAVSGHPIWVTAENHQGGVVIAVDDAGPEVPEGLRHALFAALQERPDAPSQHPRGATGLSLLSKLAELHGGRAWVEERRGGGASFRVLLPDSFEGPRGAERADEGVFALGPEVTDGDREPIRPASYLDSDDPDDADDRVAI